MSQLEPIETLLADLGSPQAYRRLAAAFELGRRAPADPRALEALQTAAATDADTAVRSAAARAVSELTGTPLPQAAAEPPQSAKAEGAFEKTIDKLAGLGPVWWFGLGISALLLGWVQFYFGWHSSDTTIFYPGFLIYYYAIGFGWIAIPLVALAMLVLWIVQLRRRRPSAARNGLAVLLAFGGVPLSWLGVVPLMAGGNSPVASARLGDHVYQLLGHVGAVGFGDYVLLECDALGVICRDYPQMPMVSYGPGDGPTELIANPADSTLTIKVAGQAVATFHVTSRLTGPTPTPAAVVGPPPVTVTFAAVTPAASGTPQAAARVLIRPQELIYSLAFSPDGRLLAGAGQATVRIWDAHSGVELRQVNTHTNGIPRVAFSPDSRLLANADGNTTWVIDTASGAVRHVLHGHSNAEVGLVAFSPDGRLLAAEELPGVRLWDPETGGEVRMLTETDLGLAFSADGRVLAIQSTDNVVRLWDTTTDAQISALNGVSSGFVSAAAFSPDGRLLATAWLGPDIKLWDVASGKWLHSLFGSTNDPPSLAFSPDGRLLASGHEGGMVRLWDVQAGKQIQLLVVGADRVSSLAFSSDGHTLAGATHDEQVMLWDAHE